MFTPYRLIVSPATSRKFSISRLNSSERSNQLIGIFPNPDSYLRLVATCLMEYAEDCSVSRVYLNPESIQSLLRNVA